ncbi:MAG: FAD-dependent oxidoreductase [Leifsonia sp.]
MNRRTFLLASLGGLGAVALAGCTPGKPRPTTSPSPSPTTQPTPSSVPQPAGWLRSRWSEDPFARGSTSFTAVAATDADRRALAAPVGARLFFAGEATSVEAPATIEGARESGVRAGNEVLGRAERKERIAVIGAGVAGLTTARVLADAGHDVLVIEARDRVGGRVDSRTGGSWPMAVDFGPVTLDPAGALHAALSAAGADLVSFGRVDEVRTADGAVVGASAVGAAAVADAVAWSARAPHDITLDAALADSGAAAALSTVPDAAGISDADWLAYQLATQVEQRTAAPAARLSSWNGGAASPGDGVGDALPLAGYSGYIDALADGLDVLLGSVVTRVVVTDSRVSLRLGTGESLTVARAVVTVPLGVLKAGAIAFEPELPLPTARAISIIGMGALDRVWLRYDAPFWSTDATVWTTVAAGSPVSGWLNLLPDTGHPVLVGTLAADSATRLAALGDSAFIAEILATLEPFVDPAVADGAEASTPEPATPVPGTSEP